MRRVLCHALAAAALTGTAFSGAYAATLTVAQDGSGGFATIQAALDAAVSGDVVVISPGTYTEDVSIGHFNVPSLRKDNITVRAAQAGTVEIIAANTAHRYQGLAAAGFDPGASDRFGFIVHGANVLLEGLKIVQPSAEPNNLDVNIALQIGGPNVTVRNCEIVGPGPEADGDLVGLVVAAMDVSGLLQGAPTLPDNILVEDCVLTNSPYALANSDFLQTGLPGTVTIRNCEFFGNQNGIEIDDGTIIVSDSHFYNNVTGLHLSDDSCTITNCVIENNLEYGIEIDNQDDEENDPPDVPRVVVDQSIIRNNGTEANHYGIVMEVGNLTVTNTIIANSAGGNVYFAGEPDRETYATFDHCDIYKSGAGTAIYSPEAAANIITFTMTNSIIVDEVGVVNDTFLLGDFTVENSVVFASTQFTGDFLSTADTINADPLYVDADNGNFSLQPGSPAATIGVGGTFAGSQGVGTSVPAWMVY